MRLFTISKKQDIPYKLLHRGSWLALCKFMGNIKALVSNHNLDYIPINMNKKPGRNDPCPCGSGKKYKKCCGLNQSQGGFVQTPEPWLSPAERTGTLWDDYFEVIPIVSIYGKKVMDFDEDSREFERTVSDFEKRFRPGEKDGITDSFFISWMHFDLRFGKSLETVAERLLSDPMISDLMEPGPTYIRQLNESYLTFYEIITSTSRLDAITVEELGTGQRFTVLHVCELFEIEPEPGEIWFARRVGSPDRSIFYTTPYIYEPETRAQFKRAVLTQEKDFSLGPRAPLFPSNRHFAESQKETVPFWAEYICRRRPIDLSQIPHHALVTTDGEEFVFTEIHFRIRDEAALRKRLSMLRSYQYDDKDDSWNWLKAKSRKYPDAPRTVFGHFRIEGDRLVAETNSQERAVRLRSKLKGHLRSLIVYEKTLYRDPYDMPEMSPEEIEARKKASKELNSKPEIQEAIKKHLEHHYFNEWPKTKLPALGGISPLQAARRDKDRAKLVVLIDNIERSQNAPTSEMAKIDIDKLRRLLGLPPKAN